MPGMRHYAADEARRAGERAAERLAQDDRVRLVYLFGSAADSSATSVRDVDLAVLTQPELSADELMRLRADAVQEAEMSIDLLLLNRASIVLAWEVANTGRCLYAATPEVQVDFVTRARSRYWDFQPFRDVQWRYAGERLQERQRGPQG